MSISFISTPALISPVFYIYLHIRLTDGSPFYVGKGNGRRATRTQHRNNWWHNIVNKHGFDIIMLEEGLTEEQALEKEIYWINRIGRKDQGKGPLVNMTDGGVGIAYINIVAADYPAINGLNPKLRIRASLSTNNIAPTGGYTFGLYPVRVTGGTATNITFSAGTVVSGSQTTSIIAPASGTTTNVVGSDFALPTDGLYVIGLVTTATTAANSVTSTVSYLQMRYN